MAKRPKNGPYSVRSITLFALMIAGLIVALSLLPPDALSTLLSRIFSRDNAPLSPEQLAYETIFAEIALPETTPPEPINAPTLIEAFSQYAFADRYRQLYTVRYTDGASTATRTVSLNRAGDRYAAVIYAGNAQDTAARLQTIRRNDSDTIIEDANGNEHSYPPGSDFPLASLILQPDPETLTDRLALHEQSPEASPYSTCTASVARSDRGRILTLTTVERDTSIKQEYVYLLDYGILYSAKSTLGELVYYELVTLEYSMGDEVEE